MHGEKKIRTPMLRKTERTTCSLNFFSITNQKTSTTQMKQSCITERFTTQMKQLYYRAVADGTLTFKKETISGSNKSKNLVIASVILNIHVVDPTKDDYC